MAVREVLAAFAVLALGVGVLTSVANAAPACGHKACTDEVAASGLTRTQRVACFKQVVADCEAGSCSCTGGSPPCSCACGDGLCGPSEDCSTCPGDCGACLTTTSTTSTTTTTVGATCGNNVIEPGEQCDGTSGTCAGTCGSPMCACGAPGELDACCCQHTPCNVYATPACPCGDQFCAEFIPGGDGYCYPRTCAPPGTLNCGFPLVLECCAPYVCELLRGFDVSACCLPAGESCVAGAGGGCCSLSCNPDTLTCDP